MNKPLKIFGIIEVILIICAVIIYFATANTTDFSGLAILYPIYGMFAVGLIGLAYMIIAPGAQHQKKLSSQSKTSRKRLPLLFLFGLPIIYMSGFAGGGLYTYLIILMLVLLGLRDFVPKSLRLIADILLIIMPIILIFYAKSLHDSNIFNLTLVLASGFVVLSLLRVTQDTKRR